MSCLQISSGEAQTSSDLRRSFTQAHADGGEACATGWWWLIRLPNKPQWVTQRDLSALSLITPLLAKAIISYVSSYFTKDIVAFFFLSIHFWLCLHSNRTVMREAGSERWIGWWDGTGGHDATNMPSHGHLAAPPHCFLMYILLYYPIKDGLNSKSVQKAIGWVHTGDLQLLVSPHETWLGHKRGLG